MLKSWTSLFSRPSTIRKGHSLKLENLEDRRVMSAASTSLLSLAKPVEAQSAEVRALPAEPAPMTVSAIVFGDGTEQRSQVREIRVYFSGAVRFEGSVESAFSLSNQRAEGKDNVELVADPIRALTKSVTLRFAGDYADESGSLIDGLYDLSISAAQISGNGVALDGNSDRIAGGSLSVRGSTENGFFRLAGDSDGDGTVSQIDCLAARNAYGMPSEIFDFDNSGAVDQGDILKMRSLYGMTP